MRMTIEKARDILAIIDRYEALERKNTDEVGWVAFMLSVDRRTAARRIDRAKELLAVRRVLGEPDMEDTNP